jgi:hypothetical protein
MAREGDLQNKSTWRPRESQGQQDEARRPRIDLLTKETTFGRSKRGKLHRLVTTTPTKSKSLVSGHASILTRIWTV